MKTTIESHHAIEEDTPKSSERSFGIVFSIVFTIVGIYPLLSGGALYLWPLIVAGVLFIIAVVLPRILSPLNFLWFKFGLFLGKIISPIVLSLVFMVAVVPVGLIMRMLGKDILNLKLDQTVNSYWIIREPPGPKKESLKNQF